MDHPGRRATAVIGFDPEAFEVLDRPENGNSTTRNLHFGSSPGIPARPGCTYDRLEDPNLHLGEGHQEAIRFVSTQKEVSYARRTAGVRHRRKSRFIALPS